MSRKKIRVLYVDDYPLDRALVRDALQESDLDFQISEAANREEFFELLPGDYDLVLSDFNILGFTGLAVLEAVKEVSPTLPVIIVTGTGSEEIAAEAIKRGAADYVIKSPQHILRLPLTIKSVLEKSEMKEEQRAAHQNLVESEARYSQLVNTLQEGIWTIDSQGVTTFVNPAMAEMLGYDVDQMVGRHLFDFMDRQGKEQAQQNLERRQEGQAEQHDFIFLHKDGSQVHTNLITDPILDEEGNYQGAVAAVRDITTQVEAEQALQNSRLELQTLVENTPGSIWTVDRDYQLVSANSKFLNDLEKAFQKPVQKGYDLLSNIRREEKREWKEYYDRALAGEKFQLERQRCYGEPGSWFEYFFSPIQDERGKIHQVMVQALDITDRKTAIYQLEESEEKYRLLVDQIGAALFLHDLDGNLVEVNQVAVDQYGYSRDELLSMNVRDLDPGIIDREGKDVFKDNFQRGSFVVSSHHRTKTGDEFPVEVTISPLKFQGKEYLLTIATDISDRVRIQEELAEREQKYRTLTEKSPSAIFETDPDGNCIYVNATWQEISGLSAEEAAGKGWIMGIHPQDRDWVRDAWYQFALSGGTWKQEYRFQDREGRITWVQGNAVPLLDEQGQIQGYLGTNTLISDRKEMEEQLQQTNRTLDALLGNLPGMAFRCRNNPDWDMLFVSEGAQGLTGYPPGELLSGDSISFGDLIHPDDRSQVWDSIQAAFSEDRPYQIEYRIIHRDGEERWVREQGEATRTDREGNVIELDGLIQDITDSKHAFKNLALTSETLTTVLDSIDAHIYVSDLDSYQILYMNDQMAGDFQGDHTGEKCYRVFRGKTDPCPDCPIPLILDPQGKPTGPQRWEAKNEKTGRWYLNTDRAIPWIDQELAHIQIAVDIHDRKLAEKALHESNLQLKLAQEIANIGNWYLDPQVGVPEWSAEVYQIYERNPEQGPHPLENYRNIYLGEHWDLFNKSIQAAIQHGKPYDIQLRLELDSGNIKWIRAICRPDPKPGPAGHTLHGTIQDITQIKHAEQARIESERRFRSSFENTSVGMALVDREGKFLTVNQAACTILNYPMEELVKKTFLEITHPDSQQESRDRFEASIKERQPYSLEKKYLTSDGEKVVGLTSITPIFDEDGELLYAVAHLVDITLEKEIEREIHSQQEFYNQILNSVRDGIWVTNQNDHLIYLNPAMEDIAGVPGEELLGESILDDFPPETTEEILKDYQQAKQTRNPVRYQAPIQTPAGRNSIQAGWLIPRFENGSYLGMIGTSQDVTERLKNARALEKSEAKFRNLFESALEALVIHQEGKIVEVNQTFLEMYRTTAREALGASPLTFSAPESFPEAKERVEQPHNGIDEFIALRPDGTTFPIMVDAKEITFQGKPARLVSIRDITQQKEIEQALLESEARYRSLVESSPDGIITTEPTGKVLSVNKAFLELSGYQEEDFVGKNYTKIPTLLKQDLKFYGRIIENIVKGKDLEEIEFNWKHASGEIRDGEAKLSLAKTGTKTLLQVIVRDITERKRTRQALQESEERYRELFQGMANLAVIYDREARFILINQAAAENLGLSVEESLGQQLGDFLPQNQQLTVDRIEQVLESGQPQRYEDRLELPDGRLAWYDTVMQPVQLPGEPAWYVLSISTNITERKEFEQRLHESEQLYRQLYQSSGVGIGYYTTDGEVISFNEIALQLMGMTFDQVVGKTILELFPADQAKEYMKRIEQVLAEDKRLEFEDRVSLPAGEMWFLSIFSVINDPQDTPLGVQIISLDITERKQIEERLQRSDYIVNAISDAVVLTDPGGTITFWNPGAEQIWGHTEEETLGKSIRMMYREQDYPLLDQMIADVIQEEVLPNQEVTVIHKDGRELEILLTLSTLKDSEGKITELIGISKDITPLKIAERALRLEQQRTQQYLDVAEIMLLALDTHQRVQTINPKGCEMLGYPEEEILGANWFDHFLDQAEVDRVKEVYDQVISGDVEPVEYFENHIVQADGTRRLVAWHNSILEDEDGNIIGVFSSGEDITDRRAAEIELLKSKETAERYLNIAAEIIISLDREGTITLLNPSGHRLLGYQPGELIGKDWFSTCLPVESIEDVRNIFSRLMNGDQSSYSNVEGKVVTRSGEVKDILWHNSLLRDDEGKITGLLSSGEDITQQTVILEELTRSRQLLFGLSQAARQVQDLLQQDEIFQIIGEEVAKLGFNVSIFSLSEDKTELHQEYLSYDLGLLEKATELTGIIPSDFGIKLPQASFFNKVLEDQKTFLGEINLSILKEALPRLTKPLAGTVRKIFGLDFAIFAPLIVDDQTLGLMVVLGSDLNAEDVPPITLFASQASTALVNARYADDLRQRTEELEDLTNLISETEEAERKRLAQELHDQVGQSLALLGFNLNQILDQLENSSRLDPEKIENAQQILNEVTSGIRSVMDDLRPAILDDYGLMAALHWYADKFSEQTDLETIVLGENLSPRLEKRVEIALFRVTQEALTNITRHAQATGLKLDLKENRGTVTLTIIDNGVGFDPALVAHKEDRSGWGLLNIQERVSRIGGILEIDSQPDQGTRLTITVPRG